jgi:hypothetical protein
VSSRNDVFRAARDYHAALAAYARALKAGGDVENLAQSVLGTSLAYHRALGLWMAEEPANENCRRRAHVLKRLLHCVSIKYNIAKRSSPLEALPSD